MKRIISFLLAVVMCLGVLPAVTDAAEVGTLADDTVEAQAVGLQGSGTAADPYLIGTADDLVAFRLLVNGGENAACARLTNDIAFHPGTFTYDKTTNEPLYNGAAVPADLEQWTPIGVPVGFSMTNGWYTGTFDGAGYTISGLYSNYQTEVQMYGMSAASLFCGIGKGGVVKNLHITNSYFRGDGAASVALACQGSIIACLNESVVIGMPKVSGNLNYAGGILCLSMYADAKIERCLNLGTVIGSSGNRGCLAAKNGISKITFSGVTLDLNIPGTNGYKYNYYLKTTSGTSLGAEATTGDLSSGKTAYLLNSICAEGDAVYGQTIGKDASPYFGGAAVYEVMNCDGKTPVYSNTNLSKEHVFTDNGQSGRCSACGLAAYVCYVTQSGEKAWVLTPDEAFSAVKGTIAEVSLYADARLGETVVLDSGSVVLNLNGHTLSTGDLNIAISVKGGELTLRDSGGGKITNSYSEESGSYGVIGVYSGAVNVEGGTVEATGNYALAMAGGKVRISGGSFVSELDYSVCLTGDVLLSGGGFRGMIHSENLAYIMDDGCALKLVDEKKWDLNMTSNAVTGQVQVRQIPFTNAQATPDSASTFEGYTADVAPKFTVTVDGTVSAYRWYEVLSDGTERLLEDQLTSSLILPEGKPDGTYYFRWEAEQDDLVDFGYVSATVLALQGELPTIPDESEPTYPSVEPPSLETGPAAVQIPAPDFDSEIIGKISGSNVIMIDAAPLQGITLRELANQLSFDGLEAYTVNLSISGNNGENRVKTSDRMQVLVYNGDGKLLASRTFVLCVMGDINCDGMALANDAALLMRIKMGALEGTDEVHLAADLDQNGEVSANDSCRLIYKYYNWDTNYLSVLK